MRAALGIGLALVIGLAGCEAQDRPPPDKVELVRVCASGDTLLRVNGALVLERIVHNWDAIRTYRWPLAADADMRSICR